MKHVLTDPNAATKFAEELKRKVEPLHSLLQRSEPGLISWWSALISAHDEFEKTYKAGPQ